MVFFLDRCLAGAVSRFFVVSSREGPVASLLLSFYS
jgi:hypothetical protein